MSPAKGDGLVTVEVVPPFQCSHAGKIYGPGEKARVPAAVADRWKLAGLAR